VSGGDPLFHELSSARPTKLAAAGSLTAAKRLEADKVRNGTYAEPVSSFEVERIDDGWKFSKRVADARSINPAAGRACPLSTRQQRKSRHAGRSGQEWSSPPAPFHPAALATAGSA
jgi:hypothetical protein